MQTTLKSLCLDRNPVPFKCIITPRTATAEALVRDSVNKDYWNDCTDLIVTFTIILRNQAMIWILYYIRTPEVSMLHPFLRWLNWWFIVQNMFSTDSLKTARNSLATEFFSERLATVRFVCELGTHGVNFNSESSRCFLRVVTVIFFTLVQLPRLIFESYSSKYRFPHASHPASIESLNKSYRYW